MKKKTLVFLLAISCTLSATACGAKGDKEASVSRADEARAELAREFDEDQEDENEEEAEDEEEGSSGKAATTPDELSDDLYDFQISIDGTVYRLPMWYSDFEAFGWEFEGDSTETLTSGNHAFYEKWSKDGVEITTRLSNLSMNTISLSESIVTEITLSSYNLRDCGWEIILPGGIQWGVSGIDDIIAAYGDPDSDYDSSDYYSMTYELDSYKVINLGISKEEDALMEIDIINVEELEGLDNSVNEAVPDLVKEYQAPKSMDDDLYTCTAQLEGVVYSLPCPVSVFLENGFTIDTVNSDETVASGKTGRISLQYNNQTLSTMVQNYADYATTIENCFVTSLTTTIYGPDLELVFPRNIKVGDSEDVLKKAVDGFNCEVMSVDVNTFYQIYDPEKSMLDGYSFIVQDGIIVSIQVQNYTKPE